MSSRSAAWAVVLALALGAGAVADEVQFNNGDRLTGRVKAIDKGRMTISTDVGGDVTVDMSKVKTFSSSQVVELQVNGSDVVRTTVEPAEAGQVRAAATQGAPAQAVPIKDLTRLNSLPVKWTGAVTANATITRGNTSTDSVGASFEAARRAAVDRMTLNGAYLYGRQEDPDNGDYDITTDNWFAFGKYDYFLNRKLYTYASTRVERDKIAELDLRLAPSVGMGYQWIERPEMNFFTEAGVAWIYEDHRDDGAQSNMALRLAYRLDRKINGKVTAFHNMEYLPDIEEAGQFLLNTDIGLRVSLYKTVFTEFKFELKHDSDPAPGAVDNDLRYIMGVGWKF